MIRILHVVTTMNRGGIESMLMSLYREIDRDKIQFDFIVHRNQPGSFDNEIKSLGGKIFHFPKISFLSIRKYKRNGISFFINHPEYKIIHSHISVLSVFILRVAKIAKVPIRIAHSHEAHRNIFTYKSPYRIPFIWVLKQFINKQATERFECSEEAGNWLFGKKYEKIFFKNGIDSDLFKFNVKIRNQIRGTLEISSDFVVGHVGNFSKAKNYDFILQIFKEIITLNKNSKLVLVGDGPLRKKVESHAISLGIEKHVMFLGIRSDIFNILQAMDVFLFPSRNEGLPVTVVEAQASGLPCILSDRITREVQITDDVHYLSLNSSANEWATLVITYADFIRKDVSLKLIKAGFDVQKNAVWLKNYYIIKYKEAFV